MNGITFYISIGNTIGFFIKIDGPAIRASLGNVSVCIMLRDIETEIGNIMNLLDNVEEANKRLWLALVDACKISGKSPNDYLNEK